jgi:hypothetical protein
MRAIQKANFKKWDFEYVYYCSCLYVYGCCSQIWGVYPIDMCYPNPIADYDRVPYKFFSGAGRRLFFLLGTGLYKFLRQRLR